MGDLLEAYKTERDNDITVWIRVIPVFVAYVSWFYFDGNWRPPSLSDLTLFIFYIELTQLGLEYPISWNRSIFFLI